MHGYGNGRTANTRYRQKTSTETPLSFDKLSTAVQQLTCGWASEIDGLPAESYKLFWFVLGKDLYKHFRDLLDSATMLLSCFRAILPTFTKKERDLGLLGNFSPVFLLCIDYKIITKCLSNRLKDCLILWFLLSITISHITFLKAQK